MSLKTSYSHGLDTLQAKLTHLKDCGTRSEEELSVFWAASHILYNCLHKFRHICACLQIKNISGGFVDNSICVMTDSYCTVPNYSHRLCQSFIQISAVSQPLCRSPSFIGGDYSTS